jgi:D-alanyl-D-alanine dipeptidase
MMDGFVFLDEVLPGIRWDAKYATWDNFTGKPVDGYEVNRIVGTRALAAALLVAQEQAAVLGYGLLLWDGYRPQRAVDCFLQWSKEPEDNQTKAKHYPHISRAAMIERGYIAAKSGHSRGSAIDLTLYQLDTKTLVPMGTDFDLMDALSHHGAQGITKEETENRRLLRSIMEASRFNPYDCEWWHYTLKKEPYPDTYFDFPIAGITNKDPSPAASFHDGRPALLEHEI